MFETLHAKTVVFIPAPIDVPQQADTRTEVRNAVRDAVREARDAAREAARDAREAAREGRTLAQGRGGPIIVTPPGRAPQEVIDGLTGMIAAERASMQTLTNQLAQPMSDAQQRAITDQLEQSQERIRSLQNQLDRALGLGETTTEVFVPPRFGPEPVIPRQAVQIVEMFFVTVVTVAIGLPLARAFARRMDRKGQIALAAATPNAEPRLERIEQAIEAIAIEVERVSEGQRFTNKLMGELRALPSPNPLEQWPGAAPKEGVPLERSAER